MPPLLTRPRYTQPVPVSTKRVPMTHMEVQIVFMRHQVGRQTMNDREWFTYWPTMSIGKFVDINQIELRETNP